MSPSPSGAPRVLLACSGLDHVHRGFETFARECFDALRTEPGLELTLVKGSGPNRPGERSVPTLVRDRTAARAVGRIWGREPFRVEQLAFGASLVPLIVRRPPDVIYLSEWHTALVLAAARRALRARFRLAYCNGASALDGFGHLDRVQQLTPIALSAVLARGADPDRQSLLPLGFSISPHFHPVTPDEQLRLRNVLGLPTDRQILLTVSALNRQKRIDYLVAEVARLPEPRPYLVLLGHPEAETESLRRLAECRLGGAGHAMRSVAREDAAAFYRASDVFVLASLGESFGRVLVEAMAHGLPCLAHDYEITRYVLGRHGFLADLSQTGALAQLLQAAARQDPRQASERHRFVYETFSWDRLRPAYLRFLQSAAAWPHGDQARAVANSTVSSSSGEDVRMK